MYLLNYIVKTYASRGRGFLLTCCAKWETLKKTNFLFISVKSFVNKLYYIRSEIHLIDISTAGQPVIVLTAGVKNCHSFKGPTSVNTSCPTDLLWEF